MDSLVDNPAFWSLARHPARRNALLAAALGWMLDSMDVMLYSMVIPAAQKDLGMSSATAGLIMSFTLLSAAAGGIGFGFVSVASQLADAKRSPAVQRTLCEPCAEKQARVAVQ